MRSGGGGEQRSGGEDSSPLPPARPRLSRLLSPAAAALAAFWLYRRALGFAYFNDDPTGHFAWMEGRSVADFFTSSAAYGYYRPVVFAVLRLFERLFGGDLWPHNPFADHTLLLLLHAANTALVWALARRLGGRAAYAWAAALVFAAAPFGYEAVAYVASLTHPLVVFWVLAALVLYERSLTTADRRRPTAASASLVPGSWILIPLLILALLTHENGIFLLPALAGIDWLRRPQDRPAARLRRLWPLAVPVALYLVLWLAIPKNSGQGLNAPADIARNAIPFLQTVVYPLLPLLRLGAENVPALVALAAGVIGLSGWLARRAGASRLWAFGLGWVILSALPALLFLQPAYVYGSPRLSYLPAIGVGLLWGVPLLPRRKTGAETALPGPTGHALAVVYILALVVPARPFVQCQLDFYAETSRLAREMGRSGVAAPPGRDLLFVNAPFFFSSFPGRPDGCPNPYPWTPTGGILIPPYAQPRDFVRFNGGHDRPASGATFAGYAPGWRTFGPEMGPDELRRAAVDETVFTFDLARGVFFDLSAAWQPGDAPGETLASFGDALALTGADVAQNGEQLSVALEWRVLSPPGAMPSVFVHVIDAAGAPVAQHDGPPAGGFAPVALWQRGDRLADVWMIDLSSVPPGQYGVVVGVYDPADGVRYVADQDGRRPNGDSLPIGSVAQ